ncbi:10499_t:CDS:1 [Diversispora eburnea]|uniref:10499_t:CDS:1 n=1 Tax=Diversispora eburnea TaxID=1213867 RepID=A0A9N9GN42_9GLOM|nr:10499_t:CDS:1 [Diversispora eburnea]
MSDKENEISISCDKGSLENILGAEFENYEGILPLIDTPIEIIEGTQFISMSIAVHFIEQYARQKKFAVIKYKTETFQDGTCRKRVFKCDLGGRYSEKLSKPALGKQKNKGTKKYGCIWQINVTRGKNSPITTVTSFINDHNHKLSSETMIFSIAYKGFSQEIMEQIEFYVIHGHCDATMIRNLLQPKYPDRVFLSSDLSNAIQKIKRENGINLGDAASLLMKLLAYQKNNPEWFVKPLIDDTSNRLIGIFWMSPEQRQRWIKFYDVIIHDNTARTNKYNYPLSLFILIDNYNKSRLAAQAIIQDERQESYEWLLQCCLEACEIPPITFVTDADPAMVAAISIVFPKTHHIQCLFHLYLNLPKNLRSCLGSLYQEFFKDFRNIQRSHCESLFEQRLQGFVEKYVAGKKYINTLLDKKHSWVKCFTSRHFTAGTQSTQRAESENALIQKAVQSSFSLLQVQEVLEQRLEFEIINNRYSIWKMSMLQYSQSFVIQTFFNDINNILKKYLTQPIHDTHHKQMCQSVCYHAFQISLTEISTSDDDSFEPFFEKENNNVSEEIFIEADEDRELNLQSLIAIVDPGDILEIWKVVRYNYPKCYQYIVLLNNGEHLCTCYMLITHGIICRHFFKIFVESSKAQFHLMLIPNRWYKDEYNSDTINETVISNNNSNHNITQINSTFVQKYTSDDLSEKHGKQISKDRIKYGVLMGEAKKAIQYAIEDGDNELIRLIKEFNQKKEIQRIQEESNKQQEILAKRKNNDNQIILGTNGILIDSQQILDPLKHQAKGRPPTKRLKSFYEQSGSKSKNKNNNEHTASTTASDMGRKCGKCGENGHYRSTCSTII